jgi:hypothetical protein
MQKIDRLEQAVRLIVDEIRQPEHPANTEEIVVTLCNLKEGLSAEIKRLEIPPELLGMLLERSGSCPLHHRHRCEPDLWKYLRLCGTVHAEITERFHRREVIFARSGYWHLYWGDKRMLMLVRWRLVILALQGVAHRLGLPIQPDVQALAALIGTRQNCT